MCGIAGVYSYAASAPPVDAAELLQIREAMHRRGPDGAGLWISTDVRVGLAHRRLAIIDLSEAGEQPMAAADGRFRITFNGEIYNYREIRKALEAKGSVFRSNSDTEVLLHLYADRGREMVHALRGMYAFAIWDESRKGIFLARDPFGIKPLYYSDDGGTFRFASQVKALLAGGRISAAPDPAGHVGFFLLGSVPEPYTTHRAIRALPAGATQWIDGAGARAPDVFFDLPREIANARENRALESKPRLDRLRQALIESVQRHLVADVPVGIFLSSGLDSTSITGLAAEISASNLRTITLGFEEFRGTNDDETPLAERVAGHYHTVHQTRWITQEHFKNDFERILAAMDQPSIDGVNTYFVSKVAAEAGMKVALSGLGGDELFGGYPSFADVPRMVRLLSWTRVFPEVGRMARKVLSPLLATSVSPKYAGLFEYGGTHAGAYFLRRALYMPWELSAVMEPEAAAEGLKELDVTSRIAASIEALEGERAIVTALESMWYMRNQLLRDADWAGMTHSLEIRVPFVDVDLFRLAAAFLDSRDAFTKRDVAESVRPMPPSELKKRRKTGFSVPVSRWMRRQLTGRERRPRGLRGWACTVNPALLRARRVVVLVTDAFGGHGGIAKFNRDLLTALCAMSDCAEVVALPRLISTSTGSLPPKLTFVTEAAGGKLAYLLSAIRTSLRRNGPDLVVCGHINLLPVAALMSLLRRAPTLLIIHGIDAWQSTRSRLCDMLAGRVSAVIAVSETTLSRFRNWAKSSHGNFFILPNCVELSRFGMGPKPPDLVAKWKLSHRTILLTIGRISDQERYKGFDEVIEALPGLVSSRPDLVYLIGGDGPDRRRLEAKVRSLDLQDRVHFLGFIPEERKADYYRLADAYVMPSRGEGFGIVFLEAMACGIPVLGSKVDGSREALLEGELGVLVDPSNKTEVSKGIIETLNKPIGIPGKLDYFSFEAFQQRVHRLVREVSTERS